MDSTTEKGVMGVCEGSVCASVQNMRGGGDDSQAELDSLWTVSSVSVVIILFIEFLVTFYNHCVNCVFTHIQLLKDKSKVRGDFWHNFC